MFVFLILLPCECSGIFLRLPFAQGQLFDNTMFILTVVLVPLLLLVIPLAVFFLYSVISTAVLVKNQLYRTRCVDFFGEPCLVI